MIYYYFTPLLIGSLLVCSVLAASAQSSRSVPKHQGSKTRVSATTTNNLNLVKFEQLDELRKIYGDVQGHFDRHLRTISMIFAGLTLAAVFVGWISMRSIVVRHADDHVRTERFLEKLELVLGDRIDRRLSQRTRALINLFHLREDLVASYLGTAPRVGQLRAVALDFLSTSPDNWDKGVFVVRQNFMSDSNVDHAALADLIESGLNINLIDIGATRIKAEKLIADLRTSKSDGDAGSSEEPYDYSVLIEARKDGGQA